MSHPTMCRWSALIMKLLGLNAMTEKQAVKLVQKHGKYFDKNPPSSKYGIRWPLTCGRCLFAGDTRELVFKLLERENKKEGRKYHDQRPNLLAALPGN